MQGLINLWETRKHCWNLWETVAQLSFCNTVDAAYLDDEDNEDKDSGDEDNEVDDEDNEDYHEGDEDEDYENDEEGIEMMMRMLMIMMMRMLIRMRMVLVLVLVLVVVLVVLVLVMVCGGQQVSLTIL